MVNGSPFKYGAAMLSYRPLANFNATNTDTKSRNPYFSGGQIGAENYVGYPGGGGYPGQSFSDASSVCARSQRQHIMIYPHLGEAGEMVLPFIHYQDAITMAQPIYSNSTILQNESTNILKQMGSLVLENVVKLRSTGSPDSTPVTISIFVWASDVEIFGPTPTTIQGDEFDDAAAAKPSAVASTIASTAGLLSKVPVIGPFALATQIAASAASSILKIFGWSNPPIVSGIHGMMPKFAWANASTLVSQQDDVLALDPKNEVTIDPRIVGLPPKDELDVSYLCSRSCILDTVVWNPSDLQGICLLSMPVIPAHFRAQWIAMTANPSLPCSRVTCAPYTYWANLFQYWRGDFVLELEVIASPFHRGRIAVSWDPVSGPSPSSVFKGDTITDILDLSNGNKMVYKVPYMAARGMLRTSARNLFCYSSAQCNWTTWGNRSTSSDLGDFQAANADIGNGIIYVTVLNQLQSGDTTSPVSIIVRTYFENMQFHIPSIDLPLNYDNSKGSIAGTCCNVTRIQGDPLDSTGEQTAGESASVTTHLPLLYSGEAIPSLRTLMHRAQYYGCACIPYTIVNNQPYRWLASQPVAMFPLARIGYHEAVNNDNYLVPTTYGGTGTGFYINGYNTVPIAYIAGAFIGWRGSLVWRASTNSPNVKTLYLTRNLQALSDPAVSATGETYTPNDTVRGTWRRLKQAVLSNGLSGLTAGVAVFGNYVSAVLPYYCPFRMRSANSATMGYPFPNSSSVGGELKVDGFSVVIEAQNC
jgi:hypothetical protein